MKAVGYKFDDKQKDFSGYSVTSEQITEYLNEKGYKAEMLDSKTTDKVSIKGVLFDLTFRTRKDFITCRIEYKDIYEVNTPDCFHFCTVDIPVAKDFEYINLIDAFIFMHKSKLSLSNLDNFELNDETIQIANSFLPRKNQDQVASFVFDDEL